MKYVNGFTIPPSARLFSPERLFFPCDFYLVLSEDDVPVELNGSPLYLKASMFTLWRQREVSREPSGSTSRVSGSDAEGAAKG